MWTPITVDEYIKLHLNENPKANEKVLRVRIEAALEDYKNGVKCQCGKDIWIVGSATSSFAKPSLCMTCLRNLDPDWEEELLCNLNRNDQAEENEFKCGAYEKI